jgi:heme exporter protein B
MVLYALCLVLVNYFSFASSALMTPAVWSPVFWTTSLFLFVSLVGKSFIGERKGVTLYLYSIANPAGIIFSRIIYGFILCVIMSFALLVLFSFFLNNPIQDMALFCITLIFTSMGFCLNFTLLSAIASKTENGNVVMAILSFPVITGILLMAIKVTRNCIDGLDRSSSLDELLTLGAINLMVAAVSYLLFPYIWRS